MQNFTMCGHINRHIKISVSLELSVMVKKNKKKNILSFFGFLKYTLQYNSLSTIN